MSSIADYFAELRQRRREAVRLLPKQACFDDGLAPQAAKCHENVDRWTREHPEDACVHGWIIETDQEGSTLFVAHSVVRLGDGTLADITLDRFHLFLPHTGSEQDFDYLRVNHASQFWPIASSADY